MHGPLNEISLIEVLQLLERGRRSGTLRVVGSAADQPRTVVLHRGMLSSVEPDADDASVHRALLRRQEVSSDDQAGAVPVAVREELRGRLARKALETMMHWSRGRFDFSEENTPSGPLAISSEALVMTLVRDESRRAEFAGQLHDWHGVPVFESPARIAAGKRLLLDALDWRVLDAVDGVRSVAAIGAELDEPLEDVGESVLGLQTAAILQVLPPPADSPVESVAADGDDQREADIARLRARVESAPHDGDSWRALGLAEVGAGRFPAAVEAWQAWRRMVPARAAEADSLITAARTMMEALQHSGEH